MQFIAVIITDDDVRVLCPRPDGTGCLSNTLFPNRELDVVS